ncbi:MAG: response regulator [Candidatus Zixiibacteriota bacterium]|nr:MAG: response regulator [candidate division Zixibacteria bacterium]
MLKQILAIAYTLTILILGIFLLFRLKVGRTREAGGRIFLFAGLAVIFAASVIHLLQSLPDYPNWFLPGIYAYVDLTEFFLLALGALFFVIGLVLYFSFWGDRDIEVANHLEKLKLLDTLQQESRYPYPMSELLDRVLKGMLSGLDEQAGALFLFNRSRRSFILAAAVGLKKEEVALLEYYPYGHNIVSQSLEDGSPMITSDFRSLGGKAQLAASNYRSILVVPLKSGNKTVGAMLFFSPEEKRYSQEYLSVITPIAEWLVEKIEVSRLGRELKRKERELKLRYQQWADFSRKLTRVLERADGTPSPAAFAERCLGMAESDEVWLLGLIGGKLTIHGGTRKVPDFSDNFRSALVSAINKGKAVILNQEGVDENGNSIITRSSVFCPADSLGNAMLFRNNGGQIKLTEEELRLVETVAAVAGMVIGGGIAQTLSESRSKGFEAIARVLKTSISLKQPDDDIRAFAEELRLIVPSDHILFMSRRSDGHFEVVYSNVEGELLTEFNIALGEGAAGRAAVMKNAEGFFDTASVARSLEQYDEENRILLLRLFGDREHPSFQAEYPIIINDRVDYVISLFGFSGTRVEKTERYRLLTVLVGLLNLKAEILNTGALQIPAASAASIPAQLINDLNNDLSAITGYCQLAGREPNLPGDVAGSLAAILKTADRMVERFRECDIDEDHRALPVSVKSDLNEAVAAVFGKNSISGNLHMIGGRPFEVNLQLGDVPGIAADREKLVTFINSACRMFTTGVSEDEIITVSTYARKQNLHIDISRHRKNFPPVEPVAGFGRYQRPDQIEGQLRETGLLEHLTAFGAEMAYDRHSQIPSYYSFRLPLTGAISPTSTPAEKERALTILAVDDQAVILDLLAAMCQSLGYTIITTRDGQEGLRLFEERRPDIVIVDLAMPGMTGLEMASRIKALSPVTPVIMITGWGVKLDEGEMKGAGVDFVLHKPFRLEQLSEVISRLRLSRINR